MRRATPSSRVEGGRPRLHLASSRLLATETMNVATIGELTASAATQITTIRTTTTTPFASLLPAVSAGPAIAGSQREVIKTSR
jgi:hypothetical protein